MDAQYGCLWLASHRAVKAPITHRPPKKCAPSPVLPFAASDRLARNLRPKETEHAEKDWVMRRVFVLSIDRGCCSASILQMPPRLPQKESDSVIDMANREAPLQPEPFEALATSPAPRDRHLLQGFLSSTAGNSKLGALLYLHSHRMKGDSTR